MVMHTFDSSTLGQQRHTELEKKGTGEMAEQFRVLAALPMYMDTVFPASSWQLAANNCL